MKKVIALLLCAALALGFIGWAHTTVTASQDDLLVYPVYEFGNAATLAGRIIEQSFVCGDYLRWDTRHTFGGGTEAAFSFDPKGADYESDYYARLDIGFSGGFGASTSGGSFSLGSNPYGDLFRAAMEGIGDNEERTVELLLSDFVDYYMPDFDLMYRDSERFCQQQMSLHGLVTGENWYETPEEYEDFLAGFRFPVQPGHMVSITVSTDDLRRVVSLGMDPHNGPELYFECDLNDQGIWFLPIFRDENGKALAYESPLGHGIYHMPWKAVGQSSYDNVQQTLVTPDTERLQLVVPMDENLPITEMLVDAAQGAAWFATIEDGFYHITRIDLATGEQKKVQALPVDPALVDTYVHMVRSNGCLLVAAQGNLALIGQDDMALHLTAPDVREVTAGDATNGADSFSPGSGELRFDGEYLYLAEARRYFDGAFWAAVWKQDELVYYGEYDCTIMRGNDDFHYAILSPLPVSLP